MRIPVIRGIIDRRMLVNYSAEADVVQGLLPAPSPQIIRREGHCGHLPDTASAALRPKGLPAFVGIGSENSAHRFAVEWDENGMAQSGVYIPRRDTSSTRNHWAGGRVFPVNTGWPNLM